MSEVLPVCIFLGVLSTTSGCQLFISATFFNFFPPFLILFLHLSSLLQTSISPSEYNTEYFFPFHFLQAQTSPAWPPTPTASAADFGQVPLSCSSCCEFLLPCTRQPRDSLQSAWGWVWHPAGWSIATPSVGPIPGHVANLEGRQKKWLAAVLCVKVVTGSSPPSLWSGVNITLFPSRSCGHFQKGKLQHPGGIFLEFFMPWLRMADWLGNANRKPLYVRFLEMCLAMYKWCLHYEKYSEVKSSFSQK